MILKKILQKPTFNDRAWFNLLSKRVFCLFQVDVHLLSNGSGIDYSFYISTKNEGV